MNTKVQNFSLVEGSRSRIVIKLPDGADPYSYTVTAGNDRCQQRHLQYEVDSISDHTITMLSEPAPSCMTIPYQLFITDNNSHVEWFVISGNVTVIRRLVGGANTESQEIEPPLSEQVLELNVTLEYSKADLDEAVALALGAASNAQQSAVDAGSSASLAWEYALCAHRAVSDIGSSVESAWSAAAQSQESSDLARQYKEQSCCYKKIAFNAAGAAEGFMIRAQQSATAANTAANKSCGYSTVALNSALCARKWSMCAASSKSAAQLSANTAETWSSLALCYKKQTCDFSTSASQSAQNAQSYKESACSASITASNASSNAQTQAQCAYQWAQCASSSKTAANSAAQLSCSAAQSAQNSSQFASDYANAASCHAGHACAAAQAAVTALFAGPAWIGVNPCSTTELTNHNVGLLLHPCATQATASYNITLKPNSTAELYLDYGTSTFEGKQVSFPQSWCWLDDSLPDNFEMGRIYRMTVRDDAPYNPCSSTHTPHIIANLAYDYQK